MRLGLGPVPLDWAMRRDLEDLARAAVGASFDAVWVAESRAAGVGAGLAAAAFVAQLIPIRVGAVVEAGLYHPLHLAEDIAVADHATGGRIEVLLRLPTDPATARYGVDAVPGWLEEHLEVLAAALTGAHISWSGTHLRVPARLEANQPVPERVAINPRPAQPAVPIWLAAQDGRWEGWAAEVAGRLGFGHSGRCEAGKRPAPMTSRLPPMLLCPADVVVDDLLAATGGLAGYFLVTAETTEAVSMAGRRLAGPLHMPGIPAWIGS